ncbi:hypothetical protein Gohar_004540 [Gossypium harknessii]|uniref:DUF7745 domain-containing protein n=1 Tax=Gossypium harknessii TaxID=34285 RepID=A0A7J9H5I5_9ROSI|nr:hypothetical protein [Gossypium harknessii]
MPISHGSTILMEQILLMYAIMSERSINVGKIILKEIYDCARKKTEAQVLKRLVENVHELNPPEPREPNHKDELKGIWQSWDEAKKAHFSDKDVMGKANGDRHLKLFAFTVYGLIVFPKALGYVSVELADFLFQIEKMVNSASAVLAKTIISVNFIRRKGDECFLGCTQLLFVWMKSHFRCLYKHFRQVFVPSTRPIEEFLESEWTPNQSIEEWV